MTEPGTSVVVTTASVCIVSLGCHFVRKACSRWLAWRRRVPPLVRHGTPRDGGRGTLAPQDDLYPSSGHLEQTAALGSGLVAPRPEMTVIIENVDMDQHRWMATQAAQRPRETPEEAMRRRNAIGRNW